MKKLIKYSKTHQFREVVSSINRQVTYIGLDENGEAIYDKSIEKPIVEFKGTVKLDGSNCSVSYNSINNIWTQTKENIITVDVDHYGFSFFVEKNKNIFNGFFNKIAEENGVDTSVLNITIFGEWVGNEIQKRTAISKLSKRFFIFGVKISKPFDVVFKSYWVDSSQLKSVDNLIFNVNDYKTFSVDVDFNNPQECLDKMIVSTKEVGEKCPIADSFGVDGIGEGIVYTGEFKGSRYLFKVVDKRHSVVKVKKEVTVDVEKLNSIQEFVEYSMTENRFNQAIESIFGVGELDIKRTGDLMRWIISDIASEEMDTMIENGLEPKEVNKYISNKARNMFLTKINNSLNLL